MKYIFALIFYMSSASLFSQNLQLHYDLRHSIDPKLNSANFPSFSFEYFTNIDSMNTGSFLLKLQADLNGKNHNVDQVFSQLSQSLKFWKPKIYLSLNYSGGLGLTPSFGGYFLYNSFGAGISYPFQIKGAWIATNLIFRYSAFDKPSYDPQLTFYFGRGLFNYRLFLGGSFVFWTENRNQGNDYTRDLKGKKFALFGDPQIWIKIKKGFSLGTRFSVFYHLLTYNDQVQLYPTLGMKYQFK